MLELRGNVSDTAFCGLLIMSKVLKEFLGANQVDNYLNSRGNKGPHVNLIVRRQDLKVSLLSTLGNTTSQSN